MLNNNVPKISNIPDATSLLTGSEIIIMNQGGTTFTNSLSAIRTYTNTNITSSSGIPEAPANGETHGRKDDAWVALDTRPFMSQIASNIEGSIVSWVIEGGASYIYREFGNQEVYVDFPDWVTSITINESNLTNLNIVNFTSLQELDLSNSGLLQPPILSGLTSLETLTITDTTASGELDLSGLVYNDQDGTLAVSLYLNDNDFTSVNVGWTNVDGTYNGELTYMNASNNPNLTTTPDLTGKSEVNHINFANCPITTAPFVYPEINYLNLNGCAISSAAEIDALFNSVYAITLKAGGYINTAGGTNAAPTSASAAARAALADVEAEFGGWTIITN